VKRFYKNDRPEAGTTKWEGLAAAAGMGMISLLIFMVGLPLWAVLIIQVIGTFLLYIFLKVALARGSDAN
jgi:hypothetical protein